VVRPAAAGAHGVAHVLDLGVTGDVAISVPRGEAVVVAWLNEWGAKDVRAG